MILNDILVLTDTYITVAKSDINPVSEKDTYSFRYKGRDNKMRLGMNLIFSRP